MSNGGAVVLETRVVSGSGGGPDKTILNTPRFLTPWGYRTLCAYMHPPGDPGFEQLRSRAQAWQAPLLPVADRGPWDWRVVTRLLDICRRERVIIWHGHDYKSNALGLLLQRFWPMRMVTTVHGWVQYTARTPLYYGIDRLCLRFYEKVLCVSEDLYRRCRGSGIPAGRCQLIENGIDLNEYTRRRSQAAAKARLGLEAGRLLIGAAGRLSAEKGFDLLIRAVDRLLQGGRDVALVILGEGGERAALEALIGRLGRADRVRLAGYCADLPGWYEAMDVFALSSLREGLPNVLLEAMALEVPVVATRVAGVPRLVEHEANGLLVDSGSADALAGALDRLLGDPPLRERLARAGRRTVEGRYSFAARMRKIAALYDTLLGRNERRGESGECEGGIADEVSRDRRGRVHRLASV
jgi:glycosyltransferase involved in cell wall biosynthesis